MTDRAMMTRLNRTRLLVAAATATTLAAGAAILVVTAQPRLAPWTLDPTDPRVSLDDVEREVARRHPVPEVEPAGLAAMLGRGEAMLFDVRTQEEFDAGHLPGAIRIEPGSSAAEILSLHRDRLGDGPVVFYCAVGVRSSQLMTATLKQIAPHAGGGVYNLRGGIFRWAADGRALVRVDGPGKAHHFDASWGQLLARTTPR